MIKCRSCGTDVVKEDIMEKQICIACMEEYDYISTLMNCKDKEPEEKEEEPELDENGIPYL